jgi:four helix bundle protein
MFRCYRELIVWQKSMKMVKQVYTLSASLPDEEMYGLCRQIRRAAVSVPSNIAEGHGRQSDAEFRNFLAIASGSLFELETQLMIAQSLNYLSTREVDQLLELSKEISMMLHRLIAKLRRPKESLEVSFGKKSTSENDRLTTKR